MANRQANCHESDVQAGNTSERRTHHKNQPTQISLIELLSEAALRKTDKTRCA